MIIEYKKSVNTDITNIKSFCLELSELISNYVSNEEDLFDIKLILDELIINSALHGNRLDPQKMITVAISIGEGLIRIIVKDEGQGIRNLRPWKKQNTELMGGRGLEIVKALADELETCYNRVICIKYL